MGICEFKYLIGSILNVYIVVIIMIYCDNKLFII